MNDHYVVDIEQMARHADRVLCAARRASTRDNDGEDRGVDADLLSAAVVRELENIAGIFLTRERSSDRRRDPARNSGIEAMDHYCAQVGNDLTEVSPRLSLVEAGLPTSDRLVEFFYRNRHRYTPYIGVYGESVCRRCATAAFKFANEQGQRYHCDPQPAADGQRRLLFHAFEMRVR